MQLRALIRKPYVFIYIAAAVLIVAAVGVWWTKRNDDPQRVFWGMVSQSLKTNGVTIQAQQSSNGTSVRQTVQYSLGAANISHAITTLTQSGTTVKDEMIGTTGGDYTRYISINTNQKSASGKLLDFSKVLGVWAKSDGTIATAAGSTKVLLSQAVLGTGLPLGGVAVPIANLSPNLRAHLIDQIRGQNVYQVDFGSVKRAHNDGRLQYTYDVTLQPILYASMIKRFAQDVGLHDLDQLDVNTFSGQQPLQVKLTVDVQSRHLIEASAGATSQTYSSYDVPVGVSVPKNAITGTQLQQRLAQIEK